MNMPRLHILGAGLLAAVVSVAVPAQSYPAKPVRVITIGAGGALDIALRTLTQKLSPAMGQTFLVENHPTGARPEEIVLRAAPDGYTLLYWPIRCGWRLFCGR